MLRAGMGSLLTVGGELLHTPKNLPTTLVRMQPLLQMKLTYMALQIT